MGWCLERTRDSGQDARQERQENRQEGPPRGPPEGGCLHITQTYLQALPQASRGRWRPLRPVAGGFGRCERICGRKWGLEVSALLPRRFHQICLGEDLEEQESLGGGRGISWHPEWSPRGTSVCHERQRTGIPGQTLCWLAQQGGHPLFQFPERWREENCLVERFQRTLQETVHRYFTARNTRSYVDVLQKLVTSYNATHHHSLGMSPHQALRADPEDVWYNLYEKGEPRRAFRRHRPRAYLEPGDHVRISKTKGRLPEKGYLGGWSPELFRVSARLKTTPVTYRISDASGEELKGSFYEQELGKAHLPDFFEVEKVLDRRERGGKTEYLVRWLGYPESFSSWTSDLVLLDGKKRKGSSEVWLGVLAVDKSVRGARWCSSVRLWCWVSWCCAACTTCPGVEGIVTATHCGPPCWAVA